LAVHSFEASTALSVDGCKGQRMTLAGQNPIRHPGNPAGYPVSQTPRPSSVIRTDGFCTRSDRMV
jgi:hypothetical protein